MKSALAAGAQFVFNTAARGARREGEGFAVEVEAAGVPAGAIVCASLVVATGLGVAASRRQRPWLLLLAAYSHFGDRKSSLLKSEDQKIH